MTHTYAGRARFLCAHWPDQVPRIVLGPFGFGTGGEQRWTVTGNCAGHPVLVQVIDFWFPKGHQYSPPILAVFVAVPLRQPARVPVRRFTAAGLNGWATRAGILVVHDGPATPLLTSQRLGALIRDVISGSDAYGIDAEPPATPLPPIADRPRDGGEVAVAVVSALVAKGTMTLMAYAHPLLFEATGWEPTIAEVDELLDSVGDARPTAWRRQSGRLCAG